MKPLYSIQYLRAVAALCVVLFHAFENSHLPFRTGQAGVDLFFVISGFVMWTVSEKREPAAGLFFRRRLARIVPIYWCVTGLTVVICLLFPHLLWGVDIAPLHVAASLFFIPHVNAIGRLWPTILQGWTLNLEMFFYVAMAAALFFPRRMQLWLISGFLLAAVIAGTMLQPESPQLRAYSDDLLLEFAAGLWIGRLSLAGRLPGRSVGLLALAAGFAMLGLDPWIDHGILHFRAIYWGIPACLIVCGALAVETNGGVPKSALLKTLGDASYSIYLLQDIVIAVIGRMPLPPAAKICADSIAAALAGVLVFKYFEHPINERFKKLLRPTAPRA